MSGDGNVDLLPLRLVRFCNDAVLQHDCARLNSTNYVRKHRQTHTDRHADGETDKQETVAGWISNGTRGVDPYGTGGTRPPNIWTGGDMITNVPPPIFLE